MHKGVICLTKATDKDDAISNVESFLEQYGDGDVWDWYVIGGRWSGLLNPKHNLFQEKAEKHFKAAYPEKEHPFLTQNMVEEQSAALDTIWAEIGGTGKHPYQRDSYANGGADDDSVPMSTCLEIINEWKTDMRAEAEKHFEKMLEAREKEKDMRAMSIQASPYYMNNREIFSNFITALFGKYKKELQIESEKASCDNPDVFSLMTHQKILPALESVKL